MKRNDGVALAAMGVCVWAFVSGLVSTPTAAAPAATEAEILDALDRTYIHGIRASNAHEILADEALPVLHRLLADPAFPRRDNVVAFLAYKGSADGESTRRLLAFLERAPRELDLSVPEQHRAWLMAVAALGPIARRGDDSALAALLERTGERASAALGANLPPRLRRQLAESALQGLALSSREEARGRLFDLAIGRSTLGAGLPPLHGRAQGSLDLFDEVREVLAGRLAYPEPGTSASLEPAVVGAATSGATQGTEPSLDAALDPAPTDPSPPASPEDFDTQAQAHDNRLTYANHVDLGNKMTDARLDDVLERSGLLAGRADYTEDVACCVTLSRGGTGLLFGSPGDGLDTINDGAESDAVMGNGIARVKVVTSIGYCGGPGFGIVGCGYTPGNGIAVVRMSLNDEGILWIHEYGHNTALGHAGDSRRLMYGAITGGNDGLTQGECDLLHEPFFLAEADVVVTGTCTDGDGDEVQDGIDNCVGDANANQADSDVDTVGNACDNCVNDPNLDQADFDLDGAGDVCDPDDDNDGVDDASDCAPFDPSVSGAAENANGLGWTTKIDLVWTPGAGADSSNVYRGTIDPTFQADWGCFASGLAGGSVQDPESPAAATGFHYLVTGVNACGESNGGTDSSGAPRDPAPCP